MAHGRHNSNRQVRPLLLCDHNSNDFVVTDHLTVATEGYGPQLQSHIVVVIEASGLYSLNVRIVQASEDSNVKGCFNSHDMIFY
jgi:hypothetical protein